MPHWLSSYDAFISYHSADRGLVEPMVRRLQSAGYRVFFDKTHLIAGEDWDADLTEAMYKSRSCVVFIGPNGLGEYQAREVNTALSRRRSSQSTKVIPVMLDGAPDLRDALPEPIRNIQWVSDERNSPDKLYREIRSRVWRVHMWRLIALWASAASILAALVLIRIDAQARNARLAEEAADVLATAKTIQDFRAARDSARQMADPSSVVERLESIVAGKVDQEHLRPDSAAIALLLPAPHWRGSEDLNLSGWRRAEATRFVSNCHRFGVPASQLTKALCKAYARGDPDTAYGLLLALGDYPKNDDGAALQLVEKVYETAVQAPVHSAAGWLLRRWDENRFVAAKDAQFAGGGAPSGAEWFVKRIGPDGPLLTFIKVRSGEYDTPWARWRSPKTSRSPTRTDLRRLQADWGNRPR